MAKSNDSNNSNDSNKLSNAKFYADLPNNQIQRFLEDIQHAKFNEYISEDYLDLLNPKILAEVVNALKDAANDATEDAPEDLLTDEQTKTVIHQAWIILAHRLDQGELPWTSKDMEKPTYYYPKDSNSPIANHKYFNNSATQMYSRLQDIITLVVDMWMHKGYDDVNTVQALMYYQECKLTNTEPWQMDKAYMFLNKMRPYLHKDDTFVQMLMLLKKDKADDSSTTNDSSTNDSSAHHDDLIR